MRLLNEDTDTAFSRLTLLLTRAEASELRDSLESILASEHRHEHVANDDYTKEISVALYDSTNPDSFNVRTRRLIEEDR